MDIDAGKRERAGGLGADLVLDPGSPGAAREILDRTRGRGADAAFEAVGVSAALQSAAGAVRKGGRLVLVGNITPKVDLPLQTVVTRQIALLGSCASQGEFATCLDLLASGRVNVDALISARGPLRDGASWFTRLRERGSPLLKVILEPGTEPGTEKGRAI
jgi:threonine dehydrogenase-like Zn-dependent dehydrogenase